MVWFNQPGNTVPFVIWNTWNFILEFLVEWKAPIFSNPASSWFALYFKWTLRFWACCIHLTLISLLHSPDRNKHPLCLHIKAGHVAGAINMKLLDIKAIGDNYFSITPLLQLQKINFVSQVFKNYNCTVKLYLDSSLQIAKPNSFRRSKTSRLLPFGRTYCVPKGKKRSNFNNYTSRQFQQPLSTS